MGDPEKQSREAKAQEVAALVESASALAQARVEGFISGYAYRMEGEKQPQ